MFVEAAQAESVSAESAASVFFQAEEEGRYCPSSVLLHGLYLTLTCLLEEAAAAPLRS